MTKLAAIVSFIMSLCFYSWDVQHGTVITWQFWMLLGFVLEALSGHEKAP